MADLYEDAKYYGTAKVEVTVEVDAASWGGEATAAEIHRQVEREALNAVAVAIQKEPSMRIVGKPTVKLVFGRHEK